jgi:hypothetical protein
MKKDVVDFCQMFLVPASILFAAIGIARTEWLKSMVSLVGTGVGALWCYRVYAWQDLQPPDWTTAFGLGVIFGGLAAVSTIVHLVRAILGKSEDKPVISSI